MNKWIFVLFLLFSTLQLSTICYAQNDENIKVAFVRGGELWVRVDAVEIQITHDKYAHNPKWSFDGQFIAYSSGKNEDVIWIYDTKTKRSFQVYSGAHHFEWAPNKNILAFQIDKGLNIIDVHPGQIDSFENVSLGVGNYSWLPDGSGFLVSSIADSIPTGWTDVSLFIVPMDAHLNTKKIKLFYTLPHESKHFFAIMTSPFKWSTNGKWIAFIAEPTASLSSDQNILCLLSSDAKTFKPLDIMLRYEEWFQWAPHQNSLAYIQGEDRQAVKNKFLKVMEFPTFSTILFTPKGFADRDFTWNDDQIITVSRVKESEWSTNIEQRPLPVLYRVNLLNNRQLQITNPPRNTGDFSPHFLANRNSLTWIRSDRKHANVWIANSDGTDAKELIKNVDPGINYYERIDWSANIAWYG